MPNDEFAQKARAELAKTNNARIILTAMNTVTAGAYSLAKAGHLPAGYSKICEELLGDAKRVYPETSSSCDPSVAPPGETPQIREIPLPPGANNTAIPQAAMPGASRRIRVGGNVMAPNLIRKVIPKYPEEAKHRGIQGTVRFDVIIGKGGAIEHLNLLSGPFALYDAARDAVLQWQYRPTLLNGQPVEIVTNIDVNFALSH